jgi:hypothetical protein
MAVTRDHAWVGLWQKVDAFRGALTRNHALNVNSQPLREQAREAVQLYFREVRPDLGALLVGDQSLESVDRSFQELLRLAQGSNAKRSYLKVLKELSKARSSIAAVREMRLGVPQPRVEGPLIPTLDSTEARILQTMKTMLPSAAASYEQAIHDLHDGSRLSSRGTAVELREALREVLDHLAPDVEVSRGPGYKPEAGQTKPTMRQKARFVLRSRGHPETAAKAPEDAVGVVEELVASLVRSVYQSGSLSTHVTSARARVKQLKMYVDTVLAELLEVHAAPNKPLNPTGTPGAPPG